GAEMWASFMGAGAPAGIGRAFHPSSHTAPARSLAPGRLVMKSAGAPANQAAGGRAGLPGLLKACGTRRRSDHPMGLGAIFVAVCMVIIAGSAGAVAYFLLGVGAADAARIAIPALPPLTPFHPVPTPAPT